MTTPNIDTSGAVKIALDLWQSARRAAFQEALEEWRRLHDGITSTAWYQIRDWLHTRAEEE